VTVYAKAVIATLVAFFGALGVALADNGVTGQEWTIIAVATLTAAAAVWGVPNGPAS